MTEGDKIKERARKILRVDGTGRLVDGTLCEDCGRRAAWLCEYRVDHQGTRCIRPVCAEHSRPHGLVTTAWHCLTHESPAEQMPMEIGRVFDANDPTTWTDSDA